MPKRTNHDHAPSPRDYWPTIDKRAGIILHRHLSPGTRFCEPCAGAGHLVEQLEALGHHCARAWDIEPQREWIEQQDARKRLIGNVDCFITNPPYTRELMHSIILSLSDQHPTWLLIDADWMQTGHAEPYLLRCTDIVACGRLRWIVGSKNKGHTDSCWYRFDAAHSGPSRFYGLVT